MDMTNDIKQTLSHTLRGWMAASIDLNTQAKLAERAGVAQATIGRMLLASHAASVDNVESVARAFGRTAADLLGGVETDIRYDREAFRRLPAPEREKVESFIAFVIQESKPSLTFVKETNGPAKRPQRPIKQAIHSKEDGNEDHGKRSRAKARMGRIG